MSPGGWWPFRPPRRLAVRMAAAIMAIVLPALFALVFTVERVVRQRAVEAAFTSLDGMVGLALATPPADWSEAGVGDWALRLAAFGNGLGASPGKDPVPTGPEVRVTLIARDGKVLMDSHEEAASMDNHANRPEVIAAFRDGYGRSRRYSATREEDLTYVAVLPSWSPETVLRFSEPVLRTEETIEAIVNPVLGVALFAAIAAVALSLWYSNRIGDRVDRLVRFSERVAQGDFTPEAAPLRMDELDALLASLNQTAEALRETFESLTAEKNQGATILSSMQEGVAVLDPALRIQYLNGAFRRVISLPGESWRDYHRQDLRQVLAEKRLLKMVKEALRGKTSERQIALGDREVLARGVPVRSFQPFDGGGASRLPPAPAPASSEPVGAVLVLMDVTRLRALERVRRDFVANLSHELKTPLTAIRGFSETLLESDFPGPPEQKRFLGIIREHAIRMSRLTDDLMRLARIEAGKVEPQIALVDAAAVVGSVAESAAIRAGKRTIETPPPEQRLPLMTDKRMLTEILQNLVDNAIQYSSDDGRVRIRMETRGPEARVTVEDNGSGIRKKHQARIFERFYRVDPARSREVGGTGLGLAIAKHLADVLGGRIEVWSRRGVGSRFTVALPVGTVPAGTSPSRRF